MNITHVPAAIAAVTTALPHWLHCEPEPLSRTHDHVWSQGGEVVTLSTWDSAATSHVSVHYEYGGAEMAHLVLSDVMQVVPFLRIVGALLPTVPELAEALVVAA